MRAEAALIKNMDVVGKKPPEDVEYVPITPQMLLMEKPANPKGQRYHIWGLKECYNDRPNCVSRQPI